jgi:uncharacterized protein YyaL (SSP411 family)
VNRLANSSSPYLLQHRSNPVDWYPWGDEAFAEARRRDIPIFLSIGYSTCYWCHVMERESFESSAIAAQMNASFVCIKVDREERPDIDDIYMAAVQAFTQRGGWPMSVFLEPASLKPFWAGTYFPAEPRFQGVPTFPQVLSSIAEVWNNRRDEVRQQADSLAEAVRERIAAQTQPIRIGEKQVTEAASQLLRLHDPLHGGFGRAPKFPQPAFLDLLMEVRRAAGDDQTRSAVDNALNTTLTHMARGGIFDQVGGGFHRYSVDEKWLIPHFEKMLYDNGALAETYSRATTLAGSAANVVPGAPDPTFTLLSRTARRICDYMLREMTSPEGVFFSAQDAEVNHREGQNYLWTHHQLIEVLGEADAALAAHTYGLDQGANFRDPHHPSEPAANVLFLAHDADFARLDRINNRLYAARAKRDQPATDTKIIVAWNGLMIAGLAHAGSALNEPRFTAAAERAANHILNSTRQGLTRTIGGTPTPAFLEDFALLIHGLLALGTPALRAGSASSSSAFLQAAQRITAEAESLFSDASGGFFDTRADQPDLFVRARSIHDGAMPSGSSVMINNYITLAQLTGDKTYGAKAAQALAAISGHIAEHPLTAANAVRGLLRLLTLDRAALDHALAGARAPVAAKQTHEPDNVVEIMSAVDHIAIGKDPVGIILKIRIAPGYHLTAADPGEGFVGLSPFKVFLTGAESGDSGTGHGSRGGALSIFADYPKGQPFPEQDNMLAYEGEFDLPIVLERDECKPWTTTPLIAIRYQACTNQTCLAPRTVELDVTIEEQCE